VPHGADDCSDQGEVLGFGRDWGVKLVNRSLTGQTFHRYVYPQPVMPADAVAVHGLTAEFLVDKPLFGAVADEV
jgi:DNA polymerase III epsilon subunit-like protein